MSTGVIVASLNSMTKSLQDLIDESIFISTEYQARLAEISGGSDWSIDFSAPSFTLQSDSSVTLTPYLLGSESENRGSWIWSWQELGHFPDSVVSAAIQAREAGGRHGISELTTDELVLSEGLARRLTLAAKALTGIYAHYPVAAGAGVRAWILVSGEALGLEAPTVNRMGRVMAESLKNNTIINQQRAVDSYARLRGAHIAWDTEATAVITTADGALRLWFDNGKISGIEAADPQADAQELARCADRAAELRAQLATERADMERLATGEAAAQVAAREEERAAEVRQRAEAEAAAKAEEYAAAEEAVELPEPAEETEGVVTTDRVYPRAAQPYDQEPNVSAEPGRVTTSAIAEEEILAEPEQVSSTDEPSAVEESGAETEVPAQHSSGQERRPAAFRSTDPAPDYEENQEEVSQAQKEQKEKKGFFSRFFGL